MVRRWPVATYFVLAYALTWAFLPLLRFSPVFGLVALLAPATAALIVAGASEGRAAVALLVRRVGIWRVGPRYYLVALLLPPAIGYLVATAASTLAGGSQVHLGPISALTWVIFPLIVGEELGWRGYAQPTLALRYPPVAAALIVGFLWGFWHLPTFFMDGLPQRQMPFPAFLLFTLAFSVVAAWLLRRTRGSVLMAMLMHGSFNTFTFLTPALDVGPRLWATAGLWSIVAVLAAAAMSRRPASPAA
jgi:hypothetical protein